MAASYSPAPASIINAPLTLPTYSALKGSSRNIPNEYNFDVEKQQAIESKFQSLMYKVNPVPFVPSKNLDFSKHENMMKTLGLWDFVHLEFDTGVRVDLIAELIASYDQKSECSYIKGTRITVNRAHLADAMKLHLKKRDMVELDLNKNSMEFIVDFLLNWVLLNGDKCLLPGEVLNWVKVIKDKHPEKLDWAGLLWFMVEKELSQGVKLEDCYYASHLQCLIKSQCDEVFIEGEAEKMELDEEMKKKDERIVCLERELSEHRNLVECYEEALDEMQENVEHYKKTLKEMHKVVEECKKMCWLPEETLEETKTLAKCSKKSLKIPFEAICKNDESKSECKKKLLGVHKVSTSSWKSVISSDKLKSKNIYLGTYQSAEAAARAYDAANLCLNRSKTKLNFPNSLSSMASYLPPSDTIMSIEIIKRVAAEAAKNTCFMENEVINNEEGESSKLGQKEMKRKKSREGYEVHENGSNKKLKIQPKSQCKNKFIGVYKQFLGSKWHSQIKSAKLRIHLGSYASAEAAARAYDAANLCLKGSKAKLNFPMSSYIKYLPPSDTIMSAETIKRVASAAAKNTSFIENALTNNGEGESSKLGQKEVKLE